MENKIASEVSYWYVALYFSPITFGTHRLRTNPLLAFFFTFTVCGLIPDTSATQ
jgi:hypothetical protein